MITQLLTIARNTFIESVRQPIVFILILIAGVVQVLNTWSTAYSMDNDLAGPLTGDNKLLFDFSLGTVFVLSTLMAGFVATAVISREIENKTVLTIVSKPVGRVTLILGKFLGVTGCVLISTIAMLVFLLLAIRHGVMSTAADELDGPVLVFGLGAVVASLALAAWCNFFYGWNFPQTTVILLVPFLIVAYVGVLLLAHDWKWQPISTDVSGQVLIACACIVLAVLVLCSVATAASTRLGQVMTILVCVGVFILALMSNYFFGRHVFANTISGTVALVSVKDPAQAPFDKPGDTLEIELERPPDVEVTAGDPFYYSPSPNGFPMLSRTTYTRHTGNLNDSTELLGPDAPPAIIISAIDGKQLTIRNVGHTAAQVFRAPEAGDYFFTRQTKIHPLPLVLWGALPNLQFFWLLDAITQIRQIPLAYLGLVAAYSVVQMGAFLSLGVILFQSRDVG
ncbi:MAG: ABC transporter permease [Phycisphaerales bacterium]|jgi:ABC-type transport system involved in multi-copper enzyme maturation permease subunit